MARTKGGEGKGVQGGRRPASACGAKEGRKAGGRSWGMTGGVHLSVGEREILGGEKGRRCGMGGRWAERRGEGGGGGLGRLEEKEKREGGKRWASPKKKREKENKVFFFKHKHLLNKFFLNSNQMSFWVLHMCKGLVFW